MSDKPKRLVVAGATLLAGIFALLLIVAPMSTDEVTAQGPDPTPTKEIGIQLPALADLIVSSISVNPDPPIIDQQATVIVGIRNQGTVAVPSSALPFYVDLYIDPTSPPVQLSHNGVASITVAAWQLPANSAPVYLYFTMTNFFTQSKVYNAYAQVDTDDFITETNESNNVNFFMEGAAYPIQVGGTYTLTIDNHKQWQEGIASNLDLSDPLGVVRLGLFETSAEESAGFPSLYHPDAQINDITATLDSSGIITNNSSIQDNPVVVSNHISPTSTLYTAWVDSRHANPYASPARFNRQIYTARSCDGGRTWVDQTRVNATTSNQDDPSMYVVTDTAGNDYVFLAWTDDITHGGDIYFSRMTAASDPLARCGSAMSWSTPVNLITGFDWDRNAIQTNPAVTAVDQNNIIVVWEDYRNGNGDIYFDNTLTGGTTTASWEGNRSVTDNSIQAGQAAKDSPQVNPAVHLQASSPVLASDVPRIFVVWEDWRVAGHPEIYLTWSYVKTDGSTEYDFSIDTPVDTSYSGQGTHYRVHPDVGVSTYLHKSTGTCSDDTDGEVTCLTRLIHAVWEEKEITSTTGATLTTITDIYEAHAPVASLVTDLPQCWNLCIRECTFPYDYCFEPPLKLNGYSLLSEYALPYGEVSSSTSVLNRKWAIEPSLQQYPKVVGADISDAHYCPIGAGGVDPDTYHGGAYIAWSDKRSYDEWHEEIYYARLALKLSQDLDYKPWEDLLLMCPEVEENHVINDNAKLYKYRDDLYEYVKLDIPPASVSQLHPSPVVFLEDSAWTLGIAWDDNRWEDPLATRWPANYPNYDSYFARWGGYGCTDNSGKPYEDCGAFISKVYTPTGAITATWRSIHWNDTTYLGDDITLQTRIGHNLNANFTNSDTWDSGGWQRWSGSPSSDYLGCVSGSGGHGGDGDGCEYDASGRMIVDRDGNYNPASEYIQFKINIRSVQELYLKWLSAISRVVIRYSLGVVPHDGTSSTIYLPVILKTSS